MNSDAGSHRVFLCIALCLALLGGAFLLDIPMRDWVNAHYSERAEHLMRFITKWGDAPSHLVAGSIALIFALICKRRSWALIFAAMLLACVIAGVANPTIKTLAGRSRPNVKVNVGWNGPSFEQRYQSFPSGHTLSSSAFFSALLLVRRRVGLFFVPIPMIIASARVGLNAHWISDVVFAAMLGFCCALLARRILRIWFEVPNE
ncbi:MAG: phosphatase PAP2 family protein [Chthoniobacterales bacterium]